MKRIVHLSDLHYGRAREDLGAPLLRAIDGIAPDLVVISGDFTQRARRGQFARAARFLDRLESPWLGVPGNHDTPLDNLWVRITAPWRRYRRAIHPRLEPRFADDGLTVVGVNTVNRFSWQRGRLSDRRIARACAGFDRADDTARIVVLHHPLQHGPEVKKRLMRGAGAALKGFAESGAQIVLSGHLHNTVIGPIRTWPQLLLVQAGTCLSSRVRGEPNTFNLLELSRNRARIERWAAREQVFGPEDDQAFVRQGGVWIRDDAP